VIESPLLRASANLLRRALARASEACSECAARAGARRHRLLPLAIGASIIFAASPLYAQIRRGPLIQPAGRVDVFVSSITAVHAGVELSAVAGRYVRIAGVGAIGGSRKDGASGLSARAELLGRFMLDPDFASRWAPYASGGLGARYDRVADGWRPTLIFALGVEGPRSNGVVPFFEAGYGGGARFTIGLRKLRSFGR
jgi:hypothetical protein